MNSVLGNSNSDFCFIKKHKIVVKFSKDERLKTQIYKQKAHSYQEAPAVRVFGEFFVEPYYLAWMEYIDGLDFVEFLEVATEVQLESIINKIINLINYYLSLSKIEVVDSKVFIDKYNSVLSKCAPSIRREIEKIDFLPNSPVKCLCGPCHGDLTFCNIIVDRNLSDIYLIDFLDPFISSPLQDIVKIRQDSKHRWILHKHKVTSPIVDKWLIWIDNKISNVFANVEEYNLFQYMNLIRILPYSNKETQKFILNELEKVCQP